jgi:hypothetical protein
MEYKELFELAVRLENERAALISANDAGQLAGILSKDLYYGHSSGLSDTKGSYLDKVSSGAFKYKIVTATVETAVPLGEDGLMVNGVEHIEVTISGVYKNMHSAYLAVWRKEEGQWCFVGHQTALLPY